MNRAQHIRVGWVLSALLGVAFHGGGIKAAPGAPDKRPAEMLTAALRGPRRPYEGVQRTLVNRGSDMMETQVRVHGDGRGSIRREYISGPGKGVVLITVSGVTAEKSPGGEYYRLPTGAEMNPVSRAKLIAANYDLSLTGTCTIAGRKGTQLRIAARQPYNPSRVLCVDTATGLILSDELLAPDGRRRSLTEYVSVRFVSQSPGLFVLPSVSKTPTGTFGPASFSARQSAAEVESATGRPVPKPAHVPAGYRVTAYGVMTTGSGRLTPAVRYSDGVSAFTVFVRGALMGGGRMGPRGRGMGQGPHRFGRGGPAFGPPGSVSVSEDVQQATVSCTTAGGSYFLIGDLAGTELARVARSLP
jgi:hypothetical protein